MRQNLNDIVLVCPDNDAEARMILLLAYRFGICVIRSGQAHGASLDKERGGIMELILAARKHEVWIVEMPGVEIERVLKENGCVVRIIDHHTYGDLDRSHDAQGNLLPSSLEQFLLLADIKSDEMTRAGFKPRLVRGIGIFDAKFVQGLREAGYSHDEICEVLDFRREQAKAGNPNFERAEEVALLAWRRRGTVNGYIVVWSQDPVAIRGAISQITIYENCDLTPLIISDMDGAEIFVQNTTPKAIATLKSAIRGKTFTFGEGRCWGVNNRAGGTSYTLDHILGMLS